MHTSLLGKKIIITLIFNLYFSFSFAQDIIFGDTNSSKIQERDHCLLPSNKIGVCKPLANCLYMQKQIDEGVIFYTDITCGRKSRNESWVCCPKETIVSTKTVPAYDISRPVHDFLKYCGIPIYTNTYDLPNIYKTNETAENYEKMGFTVTPIIVDEDLLQVYKISNSTFSKEIIPHDVFFAVGGAAARRVLTVHMAILGNVVKNVPKWFCDGVIINRNWVLSAAHCFVEKNPDIVRLGEYDLSNDAITSDEFPMNFGIKNVIIYPKYKYPSAYHDLALIELDRAIPYHRPDMRPICLPWGKGGDRNLIGEQITLTGWGATIYGGPSSPIVQEVNVTVFDPSVCDKSYSKLPNYSEKFPKGITTETTLCAGDVNGGKDSCQGDSGGPVVYIGDYDLFTLAGIVSTGFGCGIKEYPGIYVPINKPQYLSWIKKVAFTKIY